MFHSITNNRNKTDLFTKIAKNNSKPSIDNLLNQNNKIPPLESVPKYDNLDHLVNNGAEKENIGLISNQISLDHDYNNNNYVGQTSSRGLDNVDNSKSGESNTQKNKTKRSDPEEIDINNSSRIDINNNTNDTNNNNMNGSNNNNHNGSIQDLFDSSEQHQSESEGQDINDDKIAKLQKQIRELKSKNAQQKAIINELQNNLKKSQQRQEQLRFATMALKHVAEKLPAANINQVEWQKELSFGHLTVRSKSLQKIKIQIQKQTKYAKLTNGKYLIENNPLNEDCSTYKKTITKFIELNHIGNINPVIQHKKNKDMSLNELVKTRKVKKCKHCPILEGQQETYATTDIDKGVILGQYCGNELSQEEYHTIYNGTTSEKDHLTYLHGDTFRFGNTQDVDFYIDAFGGCKSSALLYINDGRKNILQAATANDNKRMNTEYVSVLCNGWPMILVRTTKKIKANSSLWIDYGNRYGLVLDGKALMYDEEQKRITSVKQILTGIDLKEDEPLQIFDEGDDGNDGNLQMNPMYPVSGTVMRNNDQARRIDNNDNTNNPNQNNQDNDNGSVAEWFKALEEHESASDPSSGDEIEMEYDSHKENRNSIRGPSNQNKERLNGSCMPLYDDDDDEPDNSLVSITPYGGKLLLDQREYYPITDQELNEMNTKKIEIDRIFGYHNKNNKRQCKTETVTFNHL